MENVNLIEYTGNMTIRLYNIVTDSNIKDIIKKQLKLTNETAVIDSEKFQTEVVI